MNAEEKAIDDALRRDFPFFVSGKTYIGKIDAEAVIRDAVPAHMLWPRGYRPSRWERLMSRLRGIFRR